ncbi:MAG: peptidoglycan editing factor PgeF [Proteobacteria bacterium]|nr:peptidoglycan editing factor PgeF [Pseudomonadota bacterium]
MTLNHLNELENITSPWAGSLPGDNIEILRSPLLQSFEGISHTFTTRRGGISPPPFDSLNLSSKTGDPQFNVSENISRLSEKLSIKEDLFFLEQVHGNEVLTVGNTNAEHLYRQFDAAISKSHSIPLSILTADCLPLLIYDPQKKAIGAVHAGWRGTSCGIAEKTIKEMGRVFDCRAEDMVVAMGPSIGPCCYEVDKTVLDAFSQRGDKGLEEWSKASELCLKDKEKSWHFNLSEANRVQLLRLGIKENNISATSYCTCCTEELFFSYRRDGDKTGRLGAIIMLKEEMTN